MTPNRTIDDIFTDVNSTTKQLTKNAQTPYKNSSLDYYFYFRVSDQKLPNSALPNFEQPISIGLPPVNKLPVPPSISIWADVELPNGEKERLKDVQILDHGVVMDIINFSADEGNYDINAFVKVKEISNVRRISNENVEFAFIKGGKKKWKLDGRGIVGINVESLFKEELLFSKVDNIKFLQNGFISFADSVKDNDGNVYRAVKIGNQVWTVENLRTTKYNDGTSIPFITDKTLWAKLTKPALCYYNNMRNADTISKFGALYNWYTVNNGKLAPTGWHVPTKAEWDTLQKHLIANGYNWNGTTTGNEIAKALAANTDWGSSSVDGEIGYNLTINNSSSFSALPGGYRYANSRDHNLIGNCYSFGNYGYWWSITEANASTAYSRCLGSCQSTFGENANDKSQGQSVRLLRDNY